MAIPSRAALPRKSERAVRSQTEIPVSFRFRMVRLAIGWITSALLVGLLAWRAEVYGRVSRPNLPGQLDRILKEVAAPGGFLNVAPVCNNKETLLLYGREAGGSVGLFLADSSTSERKQIEAVPSSRIPPRLIGWSPDDRYLAFAGTGKSNQLNRHISIRDGGSGAALSAFDLPETLERGVWLSSDSLILCVQHKLYLYNFQADSRNLGRYGEKGLVQLQFNAAVVPSSLAPMGGRAIAYADGSNIWSLNIASGRATQLTHLTNATVGQLDYSAQSNSFLFSLAMSGRGSDPRLYSFSPRTNAATGDLARFTDKFNFEQIHYGNWIAKGSGIAYAGQNFIGVTAKNGAFHTNLFSGGYYRNFSVSPLGGKIFALASVANEPLGIWSFDIDSGDLHNLVPPKEHLDFSEWVEPVQVQVVRTNGRRLDYSILVPPFLEAKEKCPAVLNLLGNNPYDTWSQFLANGGVISASIRYRSLDDAKAIGENLLKQTHVDPRRLYIVGQGGDAATIKNLLGSSPGLWRGVILIRPSEFPQIPDTPAAVPLFLLFSGSDGDIAYALKAERFLQTTMQRMVPARLLFDEDMARVAPRADLNLERDKIMARFILTGDLK